MQIGRHPVRFRRSLVQLGRRRILSLSHLRLGSVTDNAVTTAILGKTFWKNEIRIILRRTTAFCGPNPDSERFRIEIFRAEWGRITQVP